MRRLSAGLFPLLTLVLLAGAAFGAGRDFSAPTRAERAARPALERIEADIRFLEANLAKQDSATDAVSAEMVRLSRERAALEDGLAALCVKLADILPELWAMEVRLKGLLEADVVPWDEADRGLAWLGSVFAAARAELDRLALRRMDLAEVMARQAALGPEALARAQAAAQLKDRLLAERLKLAAELASLRRENPSGPERLERILELASRDGLSPVTFLDKPLVASQGEMPWPVEGVQAWAFDPDASPPRNGVGLAAAPGAPVRAVHWGRVAFAGELPGLGGTVVLAHGGGAFSVYSHLARPGVKPGQEAPRGAALGEAGGLAPGGVSGMSFELRFGLKPINPSRWLLAR